MSQLTPTASSAFCKSFASNIVDEFYSHHEKITGRQIVRLTSIEQVNFFVLKELLEHWSQEAKKFNSPFFNYKSPEVSTALKTFSNVLSKNILIGKEDFSPLLERAVSATLMLLFDPASYYINELKKRPPNYRSLDIKPMSKYIKLYKPLFQQLASALEDNAEDYASIISRVVRDFGQEESEQNHVVGLLNRVVPCHFKEKMEQKPLADAPQKPIVHPSASPKAKNINEQYSGSRKTLNQQYKKEERSTASLLKAKKETHASFDLKNSISLNQRYMFINDLFEGNDQDYEAAIDRVEGLDNFNASVEFLIHNYSNKYAWKMDKDEVKEFFKVIFKRFRGE